MASKESKTDETTGCTHLWCVRIENNHAVRKCQGNFLWMIVFWTRGSCFTYFRALSREVKISLPVNIRGNYTHKQINACNTNVHKKIVGFGFHMFTSVLSFSCWTIYASRTSLSLVARFMFRFDILRRNANTIIQLYMYSTDVRVIHQTNGISQEDITLSWSMW